MATVEVKSGKILYPRFHLSVVLILQAQVLRQGTKKIRPETVFSL
jgi:hypothetical protein